MFLLRKWRLRKRMMRLRGEFAAYNLARGRTHVTCPECRFWAFGETEAQAEDELRWHHVLRHASPLDEEEVVADVHEA